MSKDGYLPDGVSEQDIDDLSSEPEAPLCIYCGDVEVEDDGDICDDCQWQIDGDAEDEENF